MDNSDQWLNDGDCKQCMRKTYCKNPCKRAEMRREQQLTNLIMEKTGLGKIVAMLSSRKK